MQLVGAGLCSARQDTPNYRKSSANPYALTRLAVEADAHIGPAECTGFTVAYGEFATSQRADVGIGPYIRVGVCICFSQFFAQNRRGKGRLITTPRIKIPFPQKLSQR